MLIKYRRMNAFLKALSLQFENYEELPWESFPQYLRRSKHEILVGNSCLFDGYFFHVIFGVLRSFRMAVSITPIPPIYSLPIEECELYSERNWCVTRFIFQFKRLYAYETSHQFNSHRFWDFFPLHSLLSETMMNFDSKTMIRTKRSAFQDYLRLMY